MNDGVHKNIVDILFNSISNDNLATQEERSLVKRLIGLQGISKIKTSDIHTLKSAFKNASSDDPYSISPTYYAVTGRRGLWLSKHIKGENEKTACLFCLHPNIKNTVVIFPPFGCNPSDAVISLINEIGDIGINFQIGRIAKQSNITKEMSEYFSGRATASKENILDWAFPVHTINATKLIERKGKKYGRIRQVMNKFDGIDTSVREIDFFNDSSLIKKLSSNWDGNTDHYNQYDITLNMYFETLANIACKEPQISLNGIIISIDGVDRGFSIWEPALTESKTANLFASQVTSFDMTNLSTYLTIKSVEYALNYGDEYMCLGGSENIGMDRYKRGFIPDISEELITIKIEPA